MRPRLPHTFFFCSVLTGNDLRRYFRSFLCLPWLRRPRCSSCRSAQKKNSTPSSKKFVRHLAVQIRRGRFSPSLPASKLRKAGIFSRVDDSNTSIGKRYARNDELGTPFGVTLDFACEYGPDDEPAKQLTSHIGATAVQNRTMTLR
jgi:hypothetical protein